MSICPLKGDKTFTLLFTERTKSLYLYYQQCSDCEQAVLVFIHYGMGGPVALLAIKVGQDCAYINIYIACLWSELVCVVEL